MVDSLLDPESDAAATQDLADNETVAPGVNFSAIGRVRVSFWPLINSINLIPSSAKLYGLSVQAHSADKLGPIL